MKVLVITKEKDDTMKVDKYSAVEQIAVKIHITAITSKITNKILFVSTSVLVVIILVIIFICTNQLIFLVLLLF